MTGPKTDDWLVHTVGLLAAAIGVALLTGGRRRVVSLETRLLAGAAAAAFGVIDVVYVLRGTIARIYLADAAAEALILVALLFARGRRRRSA